MLQSAAEQSFEGAMVLTPDLQILSLKKRGNEMHLKVKSSFFSFSSPRFFLTFFLFVLKI